MATVWYVLLDMPGLVTQLVVHYRPVLPDSTEPRAMDCVLSVAVDVASVMTTRHVLFVKTASLNPPLVLHAVSALPVSLDIVMLRQDTVSLADLDAAPVLRLDARLVFRTTTKRQPDLLARQLPVETPNSLPQPPASVPTVDLTANSVPMPPPAPCV